MWKFISAILGASLLSSATSLACSCAPCDEDKFISEYLIEYDYFWARAEQTKIIKETSDGEHDQDIIFATIETKGIIEEGYGKYKTGDEILLRSWPASGGSCGIQPYLGSLELYAVKKPENFMHHCICKPPMAPLIKYLKTGEDRFVPGRDNCFAMDSDQPVNKDCSLWSDPNLKYPIQLDANHIARADERRRIFDRSSLRREWRRRPFRSIVKLLVDAASEKP